MKWSAFVLWILGVAVAGAQEGKERRQETILLLPEPRVLRTELSVTPHGAAKTVLSPARELPDFPGLATYSAEEFKRLGLSVETFATRARAVADKLIATLKPEVARDEDGRVIYALYRSERPVVASLLVAPSLPKIFEEMFGKEVWAVTPNRHSLFIFPAKPEVLKDFTEELAERFKNDPYGASGEIFSLKAGEEPRVVGSYDE